MIHIKDRLKQYKDKYSGCYKYAGLYVKVIQDMIEQLQDDLEQDEKENGWIPVNTSDAGFAEGWNQCVDEITGGMD